jgi:hypothetical protein
MSKYHFNENKIDDKAENQPSNCTVRDYGAHYIVLVLRVYFFSIFEEDSCT